MRWHQGVALLAFPLLACEPESEVLPPFAEVEVVIDTDVDVEALGARLQIDLYDEHETWFLSRALQRDELDAWPTSFVLTGPRAEDPGAEPRTILVRVRLFPDGKVRDYRGERFFSPGFLEDPAACLPLVPPGFGDRQSKQLVQLDSDGETMPPVTVADEPQPGVTIDRMIAVSVEPGKLARTSVTLRGACFSRQADFGPTEAPGDEVGCITGDPAYEALGVVEPAPALPSAPLPVSLAGSFPAPARCSAPLRSGDFQSFEEEVCVDGGLFLLGDPAVFGDFPFDAAPERAAVIPALRVDRFEVTVGRFRKALKAGLLDGVELPVANDGPMAYASGDERDSCTFSASPEGREDYPLNCVSWETARTFCQRMGGDLPSEAQWEYVATAAGRAGETRFPWGSEEPTCLRAVYARAPDAARGATHCAIDDADVGLLPLRENESASGDRTGLDVVGMGGSLQEMTLDSHRAYCSACWVDAPLDAPVCSDTGTEFRTVRGGDWASGDDSLLAGARNRAIALGAWSSSVGFRCVRSGVE